MNSQQTTTTLLIASILAFALLANISAPVFATGGLDDEEEEEAIEELQDAVDELKGTLGTIELNLTTGANDITANCPQVTNEQEEEEVVEPVEQNITNDNNETQQQEEQQPQCPLAPSVEPEPEPEVPPVTTVIPSPVQQNNTGVGGCSPVVAEEEQPTAPEPEENQTSDLEPIICPINGDLLGYTNTTSGEQLPISAVLEDEQNNGTIPFLPPIQLPTEEEPEQAAAAPTTEQNNQTTTDLPSCNVTQQEEQEQPTVTIQDEQPIASIEYEASCGCFVVDKSPEEVQ